MTEIFDDAANFKKMARTATNAVASSSTDIVPVREKRKFRGNAGACKRIRRVQKEYARKNIFRTKPFKRLLEEAISKNLSSPTIRFHKKQKNIFTFKKIQTSLFLNDKGLAECCPPRW